MGIAYFIFVVYVLLCIWQIPKSSFLKNSGLTEKEARILLVFKMLAGLVCAFYFQQSGTNADYLEYNTEGKLQHELLISNPALFFTDFTTDLHTYGPGGLFESGNSFWAYLRFSLLFKLLAVFNLATGGNFYFNTVIFCSLVFFGHVAFYRIYSDIYKGHKLKLLLVCFFLPSLVLYTSCTHKDGLTFLGIGIAGFSFYTFLAGSKPVNYKHLLFFLLGMAIVFLLRNYVLIALVPAMAIAVLAKMFPLKKNVVFVVGYAIFFLLFFLSGYTDSFVNMPAAVVKRKADFVLLGEASTNIAMNELYPTIKSFARNAPQAVNHFLFRPYLWEFSRPAVLLTAIELFFYQVIIVTFIFFRKKNGNSANNFNLFGYALFLNMMLIIGYTIPNIGAIVRYRSIFWIFILCPLVCNTYWKRLWHLRKNSPGNQGL